MKAGHCREICGQSFAMASLQLLNEVLDVFAHELLCGCRLPVFTAGSRVAGDAARDAIAGGGGCAAAVVVALIFHCFCSCRPCRVNLLFTKAQPTNSTGRTTGGNEGSDGGSPEEGRVQVTNSLIVWRAGGACPNGRKRPIVGRPPERREVDGRRAQRLLDLSRNQRTAICEDRSKGLKTPGHFPEFVELGSFLPTSMSRLRQRTSTRFIELL